MRINKDISAIRHILDYCDRIESTKEYFQADVKVFEENHIFRDAVALCVLQIGELTSILSDEFKTKYQDIPWRQIKALRNIVAHKYGTIDAALLWDIMIEDIPKLKESCLLILEDKSLK